jgi:gamma-glutamyl:cysteine ligase YbdK (ATP-grasp superfamily)
LFLLVKVIINKIKGRTIARDIIEKLLEQLMLSAKDQSCALIFNEMASIMTTLNLLDKY